MDSVHPGARVLASADVGDHVRIGDGSTIWHLAQIREHARIGAHCNIGRGAYVGPGVHLGDNVKLQNYALVYEPARLANGVFVGPAAILTNDRHPRAVNPDGRPKQAGDWEPVGVMVGEGATFGARVVCVGPAVIGRWSMIAAGAVVTSDVLDFALVAGVPARQVGWVGRAGVALVAAGAGRFICPVSGAGYREWDGLLAEV
jgi:acetyltransferase-like isoleucine patch superfamily enzyme